MAGVACGSMGASLAGGRRGCLPGPMPPATGPQARQGAAVGGAPARFRPEWIGLPALRAGSLLAGRLRAGAGRPLDEPGWSLRSEDQAGNITVTGGRRRCVLPIAHGYRTSPDE